MVPRQVHRTNSRLFVSILHEAQMPHPVLLKVLPVGRDQRLGVRRVFTICAHPTDRFKALKMTPRQQNSGVATDAIMVCLWKGSSSWKGENSRLPLPLSSDRAVNYSPKLHFQEACAPRAAQEESAQRSYLVSVLNLS